MQQSFIPGKDAPLEVTIQTMQQKLETRGFHVEEVSWLNPVEGVWSVHVHDVDCPLLFSNGKGASELAARASALGEFLERLSSHHFWTHYYLGSTRAAHSVVHDARERWFDVGDDGQWPEDLLNTELRDFYDPNEAIDAQMLVDLNSGNADRGICALPYTRLRDSETTWIPVNIVGNLYLSNGIAAGNSLHEARSQALSEVLERHVKYQVISQNMCLPDVPDEVLARYPASAAGIAALRAAGFGILVKDASLGGQFPVMNVTLLHPKDHGCFASFGAHPNFGVALERALTELLQGRALNALEGFPPPGLDIEDIAAPANLEIHFVDSSGIIGWNFLRDSRSADYEFVDWNFGGSTQEDYTWLCECIHQLGKDIYAIDFTHLGVYTCRMLVPGISEIYPVEDLEWENNSIGNALREYLIDLPALNVEQCSQLLTDLLESDLADERPLWELLGLAVAEGSAWKQLRIGELKILLALAAGEHEAARECCEWLVQFNDLDPLRANVYHCVQVLLELDSPAEVENSLKLLYGAEALQHAQNLFDGKERFFGLGKLGADFEGSALHYKLLEAFDKVMRT